MIREIEQCCFNSVPDPFNSQTVNFSLKPPKVFMLKKADLKHYNTVLQQHYMQH